MGRKKVNNVYNYFDYDEVSKTSKCRMENCGKVLRGNHGANLLRHFYAQHRWEYYKIQENNKENETPTTSKNTTLSIVIDKCTNLVAVHGRPFSILEDEAFKDIISLIPDLKIKDCSVINIKNIRTNIQEKAYEVRRKIHDEIKDKLISLKIDVASVKSRRFLGVNIQYILNSKIVLRNLGVLELHGRNTAEFLKESVIMVMSRYGIELKQLYSLTSDNGANMLSMSRQLEQDLQASVDTQDTSVSEWPDSDKDDEVDVEFEQLIRIAEVLDLGELDITEPPKMTAVRCAAHTLQLAIRDASSELESLFNSCRRVARALRSPNNALKLRDNNLPQAIIDCPTRWDSTADMIERILILKNFLTEQTDSIFQILNTDGTWQQLHECLKALTPCRILSKHLQKEQLTFGDFYLFWANCKLEINKLDTAFAFKLIRCMKDRESALMTNDCFISAIYLDPRINSILTDEQLENARNHLVKTYQRAAQLHSTGNEHSTALEEIEVFPSSTSATTAAQLHSTGNEHSTALEEIEVFPSSTSATTELNTFLQNQFRQRQHNMRNFNSEYNLQRILIEFLNQPLLAVNTNILNYWHSMKIREPQLYMLSNIILAAPPTQVSVERLFSSLKFVMNNLRMSLKDTIIDDILVIRNNALYN